MRRGRRERDDASFVAPSSAPRRSSPRNRGIHGGRPRTDRFLPHRPAQVCDTRRAVAGVSTTPQPSPCLLGVWVSRRSLPTTCSCARRRYRCAALDRAAAASFDSGIIRSGVSVSSCGAQVGDDLASAVRRNAYGPACGAVSQMRHTSWDHSARPPRLSGRLLARDGCAPSWSMPVRRVGEAGSAAWSRSAPAEGVRSVQGAGPSAQDGPEDVDGRAVIEGPGLADAGDEGTGAVR